jgi:hypothetical protein
MTITKDSIGQSYRAVRTMNDIAGNLSGEMYQKVDAQLGFLFEELSEAIGGLEKKDAVELLDGAIDVWVVAAGLLQKLEAAGFNVAEAMERVDNNNLSKFPALKPELDSLPVEAHNVEFNETYGRFVIKRADGKFLKPKGYTPVDLSDLVNKEFFAAVV